jgi:hypothetical protein
MTGEDPQPETDVERLADPGELLFRQVHPTWVDDGVPTSQMFAPTPKDEGMLSIARGSLTTAEAAFKHYTTVQKFASAGTWAITVGEADNAGLECFNDDDPELLAHGFIDFRGLGRKEAKRRAMLLTARARARGRLFPLDADLGRSVLERGRQDVIAPDGHE